MIQSHSTLGHRNAIFLNRFYSRALNNYYLHSTTDISSLLSLRHYFILAFSFDERGSRREKKENRTISLTNSIINNFLFLSNPPRFSLASHIAHSFTRSLLEVNKSLLAHCIVDS